jgi:hypothetical protein
MRLTAAIPPIRRATPATRRATKPVTAMADPWFSRAWSSVVATHITAARALAIGTTARVIAGRRLRAAGVTGAAETGATAAIGETMEAEIGGVMADRKQAALKAAGRRNRRATLADHRRQRPLRRCSSRAGQCRILANLIGAKGRRNNLSITTSPLLASLAADAARTPPRFRAVFIVCRKSSLPRRSFRRAFRTFHNTRYNHHSAV